MRPSENVARLAELQQVTSSVVRSPEEIVGDLQSLEEPVDLSRVQCHLQELTTALVGADALSAAVSRESALQALKGKVQAPAKLIDAALALQAPGEIESGRSGQAVEFSDPEPWPEAVYGAELLQELVDLFGRHIVLSTGAAEALALWTLHTYSLDAAWITPRLAVTSPVKRCGKSLVLTLLEELVYRPLMISNVTVAAVFRCIDKYRPTLLVDEADTFLGKQDELRGVLNGGHHRRGRVLRVVGEDHEPRAFATFSAVAIAMIGKLPDTLADRSIEIRMRRKTAGEVVERVRSDRLSHLERYRRRCARWARDHKESLQSADPAVPEELHDRAADNWRALLAVADACGDDWPDQARETAKRLSLGSAEDAEETAGVALLTDLREVSSGSSAGRWFTETLLQELHKLEEKPWGEWRRGRPLSGVQLARLLKPFGIRPKQVRVGGQSKKGYDLGDFEDAFSRYLPAEPKHRNNPDAIRVFGGFRVETEKRDVSGQQEIQVTEEKQLRENVSGVSGRNRDLAAKTGVSTRNTRPAERQLKDWIEV